MSKEKSARERLRTEADLSPLMGGDKSSLMMSTQNWSQMRMREVSPQIKQVSQGVQIGQDPVSALSDSSKQEPSTHKIGYESSPLKKLEVPTFAAALLDKRTGRTIRKDITPKNNQIRMGSIHIPDAPPLHAKGSQIQTGLAQSRAIGQRVGKKKTTLKGKSAGKQGYQSDLDHLIVTNSGFRQTQGIQEQNAVQHPGSRGNSAGKPTTTPGQSLSLASLQYLIEPALNPLDSAERSASFGDKLSINLGSRRNDEHRETVGKPVQKVVKQVNVPLKVVSYLRSQELSAAGDFTFTKRSFQIQKRIQFDQQNQRLRCQNSMKRPQNLANSVERKTVKESGLSSITAQQTQPGTRQKIALSGRPSTQSDMARHYRNGARRKVLSHASTDLTTEGPTKVVKKTPSFKEEMARQRLSTERFEVQSTSAGGFYSSMREGSDGWTAGRRTFLGATMFNPETQSQEGGFRSTHTSLAAGRLASRRHDSAPRGCTRNPRQSDSGLIREPSGVMKQEFSMKTLNQYLGDQTQQLLSKKMLDKAYRKFFKEKKKYQHSSSQSNRQARATNRSSNKQQKCFDYGQFLAKTQPTPQAHQATFATPYHDQYLRGMAGCTSIDSDMISSMMPSMEVVIGAGKIAPEKDYFGNCEKRAREIRVELDQLNKTVSSINKKTQSGQDSSTTEEIVQQLKNTGRLRQQQSRKDRVKKYITGQNYRKVEPETLRGHEEIIEQIKIVKAAHEFRSRTTVLKNSVSGKTNVSERVRRELLKDAKKSMLNTVFSKGQDGYQEFQQFINKDFYEKYLPQEETIFELCQFNEGALKKRPVNPFRNIKNQAELVQKMQGQQKMLSQIIVKEKTFSESTKIAKWLMSNTKFFGQMSLELVQDLAQLIFVAPGSEGGGVYNKGQPIISKGVRPRMIYIVFQGAVRCCSLMNRFVHMDTFQDEVDVKILDQDIEVRSESDRLAVTKITGVDDNIPIRDNSFQEMDMSSYDLSDTNSDYEFDRKLPTQLMERGAVFGYEEIQSGLMMDQDYVGDSLDTRVLCLNGFDFQIAVDKYLLTERRKLAEILQSMKTFEHWSQGKVENLTQHFSIKRHRKGEIVLENGQDIEEVIFVRQGKIRLQKLMISQEHNIHPSNEVSLLKKPTWDLHKQIREQELSVLTIGPKKFIGAQEVNQNSKFMEGTLYVDEDETILCYINKVNFLQAINDKELQRLLKQETDCAQYPLDEDIQVRIRAEKEIKQMRGNFLLDACNRNKEPSCARQFDASLLNKSPKRVMHVWADQFQDSVSRGNKTKPLPPRSNSQLSKPKKETDDKLLNKDVFLLQSGSRSRRAMLRRQERKSVDLLIAGKDTWQKNVPGFQPCQEQRVDLIQQKLKKQLVKQETQGLTKVQKERYDQQMKAKEAKILKKQDIEFDFPQGPVLYQNETLNKIELVDFCEKEAQVSGKVAEYMIEQLTEQLKYNEVYKKAAAQRNEQDQSKE